MKKEEKEREKIGRCLGRVYELFLSVCLSSKRKISLPFSFIKITRHDEKKEKHKNEIKQVMVMNKTYKRLKEKKFVCRFLGSGTHFARRAAGFAVDAGGLAVGVP